MNMLGLAKRCRARFLISSTSEVYGDPLQHPQVGRRARARARARRPPLPAAATPPPGAAAPRCFLGSRPRPAPPPSRPLQTEEYWGNVNPIGERSCYDEGKRAAECLTMDYHREHGQEVGGARGGRGGGAAGCRGGWAERAGAAAACAHSRPAP